MALIRYLPLAAARGWLRAFERRHGVRIGSDASQAPAIRLTQPVGFAVDPRAVWRERGAGPPELQSPEYGLLAPNGPLPDRLTELVLHAPDGRVVAGFLDLLIQRTAQLHHRAWAQLRPECEAGYPENRFRLLLDRLAGGAFVVPHLAWQPPSPEVLPALARQKLDLHVRVDRNAVRWHPNTRPAALGRSRLGHGIVGSRVAMHAGRDATMQLRLYPRDAQQMAALRDPGGALASRLMMLARECHGADAQVRWQVIPPADLPSFRLCQSPLGLARLHASASQGVTR